MPETFNDDQVQQIDLVMESLMKDPRNHQAKDLHKIARPIALEYLKNRGYTDDDILALV